MPANQSQYPKSAKFFFFIQFIRKQIKYGANNVQEEEDKKEKCGVDKKVRDTSAKRIALLKNPAESAECGAMKKNTL